MTNDIRIELLNLGLKQLNDEQLQRVTDHEGPMLLDGGIFNPGTGYR